MKVSRYFQRFVICPHYCHVLYSSFTQICPMKSLISRYCLMVVFNFFKSDLYYFLFSVWYFAISPIFRNSVDTFPIEKVFTNQAFHCLELFFGQNTTDILLEIAILDWKLEMGNSEDPALNTSPYYKVWLKFRIQFFQKYFSKLQAMN